jgi:hypothetical protein
MLCVKLSVRLARPPEDFSSLRYGFVDSAFSSSLPLPFAFQSFFPLSCASPSSEGWIPTERPPREPALSSVRGRSSSPRPPYAELGGGAGREDGARGGGVALNAGAGVAVFAAAAATLALIASSRDIAVDGGTGFGDAPFALFSAGGGGVGVPFVFPVIARALWRASLIACALRRASATCWAMSTGAGLFFESDIAKYCKVQAGDSR